MKVHVSDWWGSYLGEEETDWEPFSHSLLDDFVCHHHDALCSIDHQQHTIRKPHGRADLIIEVDVPCVPQQHSQRLVQDHHDAPCNSLHPPAMQQRPVTWPC